MIGTPKFMSPEQTRGEKLTQQSDIYNLGLILYAMLTGKEPFSSDSPVGYVFHHNMTQPAPVSSLRRGVPVHVECAIQKALSKEPGLRFETAAEFIAALSTGHGKVRNNAWANRSAIGSGDYAERPVSSVWRNALVKSVGLCAFVLLGMLLLKKSPVSPLYSDGSVSFDSTMVGQINADTVRIVFRESASPQIITPALDSLNDIEPESKDVPLQQPAATALPVVRAALQEAELEDAEEEIDPNLLYYSDLRLTSGRGTIRFASERKSIEENSNILRLRDQQRRARQAELKELIRQNKEVQLNTGASSNTAVNALPRVEGGVERLRSQLRYPDEAAMERVMGTVGVRVLIDDHGELKAEEITQSLGYGCDDEVLRVLKDARFEAARLNNKPVKAWLNLQFSFQLLG